MGTKNDFIFNSYNGLMCYMKNSVDPDQLASQRYFLLFFRFESHKDIFLYFSGLSLTKLYMAEMMV